jgi:hypothetical protein
MRSIFASTHVLAASSDKQVPFSATHHNALVISWSFSQQRAVDYQTQYQQQRLFK